MKTATTKKRYQRHPWPLWFARKKFALHRGIDYAQASYSMAQAVRNVAAKRGVSVSISIEEFGAEEWIEVEVYKRGKNYDNS